MGAGFIIAVFLIGSILFIVGAAVLWGGAGFTMAVGLVLILFAHAAMVAEE